MFIIGVFGTHATFAAGAAEPSVGLERPDSCCAAVGVGAVIDSTDRRRCELLVGRSTLVDIGTPIARVSLTSADVADALVTSPKPAARARQDARRHLDVRLGSRRRRARYEMAVQRDLARLNDQVKQLFPGEAIQVARQR